MAQRRYRLQKRAESQDETRRRITEVAVELHGTVGPARTTVADIARGAGVQRLTVYSHFPDLSSLFAACTTHWFGQHPPPDLSKALGEPDLHARLSGVLFALYEYYGTNEQMFANWLRDAQLIPELGELTEVLYYGYVCGLRESCLEGIDGAGPETSLPGMLLVALHFETWRMLCRRQRLGARDAAAVMAGSLYAAFPGSTSPRQL